MPPSDRRLFLKFLGAGLTGGVMAGGLGPLVRARGSMPFQPPAAFGARNVSFTPIVPSQADDLVLPPGFEYRVVASWGDPLPGTTARFGYNADYTAYLPLGEGEGLLWVNHEYVSLPEAGEAGVYPQTFQLMFGRTATAADMMADLGGSVLHIVREQDGAWRIRPGLTRRYDAQTPMRADGPALRDVRNVGGTFGNCSGCRTPWNTVLTCEENVQYYVADDIDTEGRGTVGGTFEMDGSHFGWVVEIDPADPAFAPVKHTALGRFRHENVALRVTEGAPIVAYMGDDRVNGHVYRFVSAAPYRPGRHNRETLLSRGRLYAAVFNADGSGEWRELAEQTRLQPIAGAVVPDVPPGAKTLGHVYRDLGAIVTDAFRASNLIGATPAGRPEDIEVHPFDASVYIAFTARATLPGSVFNAIYGELCRLVDEGDGTGTRFSWMRWKAGGPNDTVMGGRVFSSPDNLSFDLAGNLWVVTDISTSRINADSEFSAFQNNGMFFIPTAGTDAGVPMQFASGPCECELAGPSWTPDENTLFLAVQHPGEAYGMRTAAMAPPKGSNWPSRRLNEPPKPSVVAISRTGTTR